MSALQHLLLFARTHVRPVTTGKPLCSSGQKYSPEIPKHKTTPRWQAYIAAASRKKDKTHVHQADTVQETVSRCHDSPFPLFSYLFCLVHRHCLVKSEGVVHHTALFQLQGFQAREEQTSRNGSCCVHKTFAELCRNNQDA